MTATEAWLSENQRQLGVAVARVRSLIDRHAARVRGEPEPEARHPWPGGDGGAESAAQMPLAIVCRTFHLTPFERDILILCAGMELDARLAAACAAAQGNSQRPYPTFSLALAALPDPHWTALVPARPLRRFRLIEVGPGDLVTTSPLRIDEHLLHLLCGVAGSDERVVALVELVPPPADLTPSHQALVDRVLQLWRTEPATAPGRLLAELVGPDLADRRAVAAAAAAAVGVSLYRVRAADLPAHAPDRETLARLWERQALLGREALLVETDGLESPEALRAAQSLVERLQSPVMVSSREPLLALTRSGPRLPVGRLGAAEQLALWRELLPAQAGALPAVAPQVTTAPGAGVAGDPFQELVSRFDMSASSIRTASERVGRRLAAAPPTEWRREIWDTCRELARPRLDGLAQRLQPAARWSDLILPVEQRETLEQIAVHVRHRRHVYDDWGFSEKGERGAGITALFAGASGTGKTMAAEVLARELELDIYRIDLSQVVSKYIGDTEKNLRRVFDAAEEGSAVLLFDEADALFGKRSEVKDSHDRYANIEVGYLLQRMESYRGLAILTTNMKSALDEAFLRRLRFVIEFPFPDATHRAEIWRRAFPSRALTDNLDQGRLARLSVAGGNIRNIAVNAAFLAANAGQPVRMEHVARAARAEFEKLERPFPEGDWRAIA